MNVFTPLPAASGTAASARFPVSPSSPSPAVRDDDSPSFGQSLQDALGSVNDLQNRAGGLARSFAVGQTGDIHSVMIASEQATIALQLTTQVRNKVVEAYQDIMRLSL